MDDELMFLLCQCHDKLADMTERFGCDAETSQLLDEAEMYIGQADVQIGNYVIH